MFKIAVLVVAALCVIDAAVVPKPTIGRHPPAVPNVPINDLKIIGGAIVREGDYPYQIGMLRTYLPGLTQFACGGVLIGPTWVLTAAQCVNDVLIPANLHLRAGEHYLDSLSGREQERNAKRIIVHPDYNADVNVNDIALVEVVAPYDYNDYVQPIGLPEDGEETVNTTCTVSGWGSTTASGGVARYLHAVNVPTVDDFTCQSNYAENPVAPSMLCAGMAGRDACGGDAGGPLTCDGTKSKVHGIVSWGAGCGVDGYPGVYTQVSYFRQWIFDNTGL